MSRANPDTRPFTSKTDYEAWAKDHNIDLLIYPHEKVIKSPASLRGNKMRVCGWGRTYLKGMAVNAVSISYRNYDGTFAVAFDVNTFIPISQPPYPTDRRFSRRDLSKK
jgi:hypothetical protein